PGSVVAASASPVPAYVEPGGPSAALLSGAATAAALPGRMSVLGLEASWPQVNAELLRSKPVTKLALANCLTQTRDGRILPSMAEFYAAIKQIPRSHQESSRSSGVYACPHLTYRHDLSDRESGSSSQKWKALAGQRLFLEAPEKPE